MKNPVAPKDPQEKRPGFYVLLDKSVGGIPQDDGKGRHSVFMSPERITSFAKVTGGITDESILHLLETAEGFRRLVHSIGVSITMPDHEEVAGFTMIFRGSGGPGSRHGLPLPGDGMERIITLDALNWSAFDVAPAEFLFEFPSVDDVAKASVRFYVNDGFEVPDFDPDPPVDTAAPRYKEMIARSFLSAGNNARVKRFLEKAAKGEDVTVAFLGGSITQGAGAVPLQENCYPRLTVEALRAKYGNHVRYIKAGVGGTPSETGLMRYERDITRGGSVLPDIVILEFAVNDEGDETEGVFYESLVKHILDKPNHPAVILLFAVFSDDWNLKKRLAPIGLRYELPMVDVLEAVAPQFEAGSACVIRKRQYFYDVYHPSNMGHRIMADCLLYMLERLSLQQPDDEVCRYIPPVYGTDYESLQFYDRSCVPEDVKLNAGSFTETDADLQCVPLDDDTVNTPEFPYNWKKAAGDGPLVMEAECSKFVLEFKDSGSESFGKAFVTVDGEKLRILDPREAGWTHCHTAVIFHRQEVRKHRIEISMTPEDGDKTFTVLGFGLVR